MDKKSKKSKISTKIGKLIIPILVMVLIIYEAKSIFSEINLQQVIDIIKHTSTINLFLFFIFAVAAVTCLCGYDLLLTTYYNYDVKLSRAYKISWICVTFNNIMGFGGLTGASIRTYLFKKEKVNTTDMINYNMILVPSTIVGLGIMSLASALNLLNTHGLLGQYPWLWGAVLAFILVIPLYFFLGKFHWLNNKLKRFNLYFEGSLSIKLKLVFISTIDWISRGVLFYVIAKTFNGSISFFSILGIDILASVAGLISFIPSGIGSYDIIALMGLEVLGFSGNVGLSIILLFRVFYFIIPWIIGGILMISSMASGLFKDK